MSAALPYPQIPGPPARFLIGELPAFKNGRPWEACRAYAEKYGPITRIKILGKPIVVLNGPEEILDVLERNTERYYKDAPREALLPVATDYSVFTSPGGQHWAERRRANPQSGPRFGPWFASRIPLMHALIEERLAAFARNPAPADIYDFLLRTAFDAWSLVFLGQVQPAEVYDCFIEVATLLNRRLMWKLPFGRPWGKEGDVLQKRWLDYFPRHRRRRAARPRRPQRHRRLPAPPRRDRRRSRRRRTGQQLLWRLLLVHDRPAHRPLRADAASRRSRPRHGRRERPPHVRRSLTDFAALNAEPCLDAVLREALRVHPPVAFFQRRVKPDAPAELGGYQVPANTILFISCYALHLDKAHWGADAETYRPSRWTSELVAANPYGSSHFFPFGRGPRACVGEHAGRLYIKLALASILANYTPEIGAGQPFEKELFFATMRPKGLLGRLLPVS
jgi:cytochrome P450